jgi:hypothetical protein
MSLHTPPSADRSFSDSMGPRYTYHRTPQGMAYGSGQTSPPYDNDFGTVYTPSPNHNFESHHGHTGQSWDLPGTIGQERNDLFHTPRHYAQLSPQRQSYLSRYNLPHSEYRDSNAQHGVDVNRIVAGLDVRTTVSSCRLSSKESN